MQLGPKSASRVCRVGASALAKSASRVCRIGASALVAALLLGQPAWAAGPGPGVLGTYVRGPEVFIPGTPAALRVATHWATSATKSQPIAKVRVRATLSGSGHSQVLWNAESDAQGLCDGRFTVPAWPPGAYMLSIESQLGMERDLQRRAVKLASSGKLLLQSDKPLYQPGQTIHLRAIAMRTLDGRPLTDASVRFELADSRGNRIFAARPKLSAFGIASADAVLADGIVLGTYKASATLVGATSGDTAATQLDLPISRYVLPKIKLTVRPDHPYYRPGEHVRLALDGRYFTDKPVAGGTVQIDAALAGSPLLTLHGKLDINGKVRLELELPKSLTATESTLTLDAAVVDSAQSRQAVRQELLVYKEPLRVDVIPEAGVLLPELANTVYVITTYPDGTPAAGAHVELQLLESRQQQLTNALGVATFQSAAPPKKPRSARSAPSCEAGEVAAQASVRDQAGVSLTDSRCLRIAEYGGLLVRTDRAIYERDMPLKVEVVSADHSQTVAYVDVWKDQQIVDTAAVPLQDGRGELTLPPSERRFGTLAVQAYTVLIDGRRSHDARLIYVDRPGALRIEVTPQSENQPADQPAAASFTPGERGRIRLRVLDSQSGAGVQAALGVVMVDEALLALRPLRPGLLRTYFQLAAGARGAGHGLHAKPGGLSIERIIEEGTLDESRQLAARILLAEARPAWDLGWELDPWVGWQEALTKQQTRLRAAVDLFGERALLGERRGTTWHYRHDLIPAMLALGVLAAADVRDPWRHPYRDADLIALAALPEFAQYAQSELDQRLSALYRALIGDHKAGRLPTEVANKKRLIITLADLHRLADQGKVPRGRLLDPWGGAFYVSERRTAYTIAELTSRYVVASAGPDGIVGTRDDRFPLDDVCGRAGCSSLLVTGRLASEAFGTDYGSACGCGSGGGGLAGGTVGRSAVATLGRGSTTWASKDSVRSAFPETMLYLPQVLTDADGQASLDVTMADSITTWQLAADAVALDGRLGATTLPVRVKQDFYVDLDLPPSLTQHDEVAIPVAVYNYLPTVQKVALQVEPQPWFELLPQGEHAVPQVVEVGPAQVGLGYVRLRVLGSGQKTLTVHARGVAVSDAIARAVEIVPDGVELLRSVAAQLTPGRSEHALEIPSSAIPGTPRVTLKVYPALVAHAIEGLSSLLQKPHGCFEQTSSATYPNALVLRFLQRTGKTTPVIEAKAREYLHTGYQRLLSFEVPGGGFSWFGSAPANKVLTAYGLEEFSDMAHVYAVEEQVIERTQRWLLQSQETDGSFAPDHNNLLDGMVNRFTSDTVRVTAYIALAVRHTDRQHRYGEAVQRAQAYVRRTLQQRPTRDPYTLALVAELLDGERIAGATLADTLWGTRASSQGGLATFFTPLDATPTHGRGQSAIVETTALAAQALLSGHGPERLKRAEPTIRYLIGSKDPLGNFTSTQATVRTLKALLSYQDSLASQARGTLTVLVDGQEAARQQINSDNAQVIDLATAANLGGHRVALHFEGQGTLGYQLVTRYYQPLALLSAGELQVSSEPAVIKLSATLDATQVRVGDTLRAQLEVSAPRVLDMPLITVGLPPGVDVDKGALDDGVRAQVFDKYELSPRQLVLYRQTLASEQPFRFTVPMVARLPGRLQVPATTVSEYYVPEASATTRPTLLTVSEAKAGEVKK